MSSKQKQADYIESRKDLFINVNDKIWEYAEIAFDEYKSSALLCNVFKDEGFKVKKGVADLPTAFTASYGKGYPVLAILGEYDALSGLSQEKCISKKAQIKIDGNGHGCGHNSLGAGALAACLAVKQFLKGHKRGGTIRYYGCPAEEGGAGKTYLVKAGVLDDVDIALTWHPAGFNAIWSVSTNASMTAYFNFIGQSAHAAENPHAGRSALDAVELMNIGVNFLREHVIPETRIHYAITNTGGISPNVVQSEAQVHYCVRAPRMNQTEDIYKRVCDIAKGAALMSGTRLDIEFLTKMPHYLPNNVLDEIVYNNLVKIGAPVFDPDDIAYAEEMYKTFTDTNINSEVRFIEVLGVPKNEVKAMTKGKVLADFVFPYKPVDSTVPGSTDVGEVSLIIPTSQFWAATLAWGTPPHSWQTVTQSASSIAHKGLLTAGKVLAASAIDLFKDHSKIKKAKLQHQKDIAEDVL